MIFAVAFIAFFAEAHDQHFLFGNNDHVLAKNTAGIEDLVAFVAGHDPPAIAVFILLFIGVVIEQVGGLPGLQRIVFRYQLFPFPAATVEVKFSEAGKITGIGIEAAIG